MADVKVYYRVLGKHNNKDYSNKVYKDNDL